ncbi:high affinity immunoglobulin epsilon receptor subunit gamma-like [Paramormyrops kingsleyae]|uniref:high affinity immunoglobulin epsilon receptor subunit gamma-like n=1 Tax=Paramormyrops kingsleyae TaxID=1676925 RepID=UPI000CD60538|nr:high affinity immunoglobulin epsilon receptor subunit gamma-like [Paramormyrops kingsleyae]
MKRGPLIVAVLLLSCGTASAQAEPAICYVLDGILFVYGIVLTVLYCRLKISGPSQGSGEGKKKPEEGLYAGLSPHAQDTYETINPHKK